jgi:hypothetical protein
MAIRIVRQPHENAFVSATKACAFVAQAGAASPT